LFCRDILGMDDSFCGRQKVAVFPSAVRKVWLSQVSFIDARHSDAPSQVEADICVVGGGAAGLAFCREFVDTSVKVVLIESGGLTFSGPTQSLYEGENCGLPSYPLSHARARTFGGSTTRWGGQCRSLDPIDFEARSWVPDSGWPFDRAHLNPWYERASTACALSTEEEAAQGDFPPLDAQAGLEKAWFRFGYPTDFGQVHGRFLNGSDNIRVFLHANCTEIQTDWASGCVETVQIKTLENHEFKVRARLFVLACGGIENARLLLASNRIAPAGVGNERDLVGRYFMDHPYMLTGYFEPFDDKLRSGPHVIRTFKRVGWEQQSHVGFALSEQLQRREGLTGCVGYFMRRLASEIAPEFYASGPRAWRRLSDARRYKSLGKAELRAALGGLVRDHKNVGVTLGRRAIEVFSPVRRLALRTILETSPRPDSRVLLSDKKDRLGMPTCRVDWRINPADRRSLDRLRQLLRTSIENGGFGRLVEDPDVDENGWPRSFEGGRHHMGTTRMHVDPKRGVVDSNCRVHGIENLFVVGSSVFPSAGYANPTLTIVALTLRLADNLKAQLLDS
jgi:choline dehydrogenase-like flavoprotein